MSRTKFFSILFTVLIVLTSTNILTALSYDDVTPIEIDDVIKSSGDVAIFKHVDTTAFQDKHHVKRLNNEEDLNSYVFLNSDGTKSVYIFGDDLKYVDSNGTVREKDISLVKKDGNSM